MTLATGRQLGVYEILGPLGAGGMGEVYHARDERLGREVALKVLRPDRLHDADSLARFDREARLLAALHHPHIATLFGLDEVDGIQFLVLEFVPGPTLAERLRSGPLPLAEACALGQQIAAALEAAHAKGIIHRDLKPANIKIAGAGQVKVLDFGLGKRFGEPADPERPTIAFTATGEGVILGTPPYMSPEQARGQPLDGRTDVWAFGCVLYEMLTGRRAFAGATVNEVLAAVLEREPNWSALPPDTPAPIRDILQRCLRKDPERRLRDIRDVRLEIEEGSAVLSRLPSSVSASARGEGVVTTLARSAAPAAPRRRRLAWILAASLLAAAGGTGLFFWSAQAQKIPDSDPKAELEQGLGMMKQFTEGSGQLFGSMFGSLQGLAGGKEQGRGDEVAVLPFESPFPWFEGKDFPQHLAVALTDALGEGKLRVTSQNKVASHRPYFSAQAAGRTLRAAHVLTGKIVLRGQHVQLQVELVETQTGTRRWGKTFTYAARLLDRPAELAGEIAAEARKSLTR